MDLSLGLISAQTHIKNSEEPSEIYFQIKEQAKLSENLGFKSLWISEHHFTQDNYCPSSLILASSLISITNSIQVGTGALILPFHNPIRVAEDSLVLSNLSNGRFNLGVCLGYVDSEFAGFNINKDERVIRFEEGLKIIETAFKGEEINFNGQIYNHNGANIKPIGYKKNFLPIYIGAFEEPAIKRAARFGYPLLIGPGRTFDIVKQTIGIYAEEAKKHNTKEYPDHMLIRECFIDQDQNYAKEKGNDYIIDMYKYYLTLGVPIKIRGKQLKDVNDPLFEHLAEDRFIIGDRKHFIGETQKYSNLGIKNIICRCLFPSAPNKITLKIISEIGACIEECKKI